MQAILACPAERESHPNPSIRIATLNKSITTIVTNTLHRLGYEIIPTWKLDRLSLINLLHSIFALHRIDYVLDVGANKGQYASFMRHFVGYAGRLVSFEPLSHNVQHLQQSAAHDPNWQICGYALGRENKNEPINVMKADVFSSFLTPTAANVSGFETYNTVERTEMVTVRRLDEVLPEIGIDPQRDSVYLKIDTQGYDLEVIAGAGDALRYIKALQTEVSMLGIYEGMPPMSSTIQQLGEAGFSLAGLFPVSTDAKLRVVEFDAIFINSGIPV